MKRGASGQGCSAGALSAVSKKKPDGGVCLCSSFTLQKVAKLLKVAFQVIIAGGFL